MKNAAFALLTILLISCNKKETVEKNTNVVVSDTLEERPRFTEKSLLIIPGTSIGTTVLGENATTLSSLGQPDLSDAAMGKAWMSWYSDKPAVHGVKTELMVSTGYKDSEMKEKIIKVIRTNSPDFKTSGGNGVGVSVLSIVEEFPNIKATSEYTNTETGQKIQIFDDEASGIAFEIRNEIDKKCIGITVHLKNKPAGNEYVVLHPEMRL